MHAVLPFCLRTAAGISCLAPLVAQVNWSQVTNTGAPMAYGASAWDSQRSKLVAFGGEQGTAQSDVTREYDPATLAWTQLSPTVRPAVRRRPAMAYDRARGECVLHGGGNTTGFLADTWTWNGTVWTQKIVASAPPPRFGAAMVYDTVRQVVVLFGGFVPSGQDTNDLWEWNGSSWTQRLVANAPSPRGAHRMVFDEARGVTVLYGGYSTPSASTVSDTWTWDGTAWSAGPNPGGPGSLCDNLFVYDSNRQRTVLFGGLRIAAAVQTDLAQTWEWDGTAWSQRSPATSPSARSSMANGFVPSGAGRVVCAGGATSTGTQFGTTFAMQPTTPATVQSFGTGCPTTAGAVQLNAVSMPYAGSSFVHEVAGGPQLSFVGVIALGLSNTTWNGLGLPFPLATIGAPGCDLLVSPDVLITLLLNNGAGSLTWPLPAQPGLVGQQFFTQGVILDPLSPLAFQIGASSGRRFTIGAL